MFRALMMVALLAGLAGSARAFDFEPGTPLDVTKLDAAMQGDIYGVWEIRDKAGTKRCRITLMKEFTIGGYEAQVAPGCEKAFPVMADISAWRLLEGWTIDLVDPIRRVRIRFETPDNRYVPFGDPKDIAGIHEIVKIRAGQDQTGSRKK